LFCVVRFHKKEERPFFAFLFTLLVLCFSLSIFSHHLSLSLTLPSPRVLLAVVNSFLLTSSHFVPLCSLLFVCFSKSSFVSLKPKKNKEKKKKTKRFANYFAESFLRHFSFSLIKSQTQKKTALYFLFFLFY